MKVAYLIVLEEMPLFEETADMTRNHKQNILRNSCQSEKSFLNAVPLLTTRVQQ